MKLTDRLIHAAMQSPRLMRQLATQPVQRAQMELMVASADLFLACTKADDPRREEVETMTATIRQALLDVPAPKGSLQA